MGAWAATPSSPPRALGAMLLWLALVPGVGVALSTWLLRWDWYTDCAAPERPLLPAEDVAALDVVHVAYSADDNTFPGLLVSMLSLARHLRQPPQCVIHIIVAEADMAQAQRVAECFRQELLPELPGLPAVALHAARPLPADLGHLVRCPKPFAHLSLNLPLWSYFYLHEYLPDAPRALYLDTDTVVRADVGPLYRMRMAHALAAAPESPERLQLMEALQRLDLPNRRLNLTPSGFFNTGVLLLDIARWRERRVPEATLALLEELRAAPQLHLAWADQEVLNVLFQGGDLDLLDWRWNLLDMAAPRLVPRRCAEEAKIYHFQGCPAYKAGNRKYWQRDRRWCCGYNEDLLAPHLARRQCRALAP